MSETIYFGTDELRMGAGKFRSSYRYLRATSSSTFPIAHGRTAVVVRPDSAITIRYSVGSYTVEFRSTGSAFTANVTNVTL